MRIVYIPSLLGTEIGLQVNKQFIRPENIVYLGHVAELKTITSKAGMWHIGAAVSLTEVQNLIGDTYPDFAEVLRRFGSPPIRSTATLAGNIANGSPIGDSMPCLLALGATLPKYTMFSGRVNCLLT